MIQFIYHHTLLFHDIAFEQSLIVPAALVIHERKFQCVHKFMKFVSQQLRALSKVKISISIVIFVVDKAGMYHAINNCLLSVS